MPRAYLIDPFEKRVSEVANTGLPDIYKHIRTNRLDAAHVGAITKNDGRLIRVAIYVDDEGYYVREQSWFRFGAYPNPLGGCGLLVGVDEEGDDVEPPLDLTQAARLVTWLGQDTPHLPPIVHYAIGPDGAQEVGRWDQDEERARRLKEDGDG